MTRWRPRMGRGCSPLPYCYRPWWRRCPASSAALIPLPPAMGSIGSPVHVRSSGPIRATRPGNERRPALAKAASAFKVAWHSRAAAEGSLPAMRAAPCSLAEGLGCSATMSVDERSAP